MGSANRKTTRLKKLKNNIFQGEGILDVLCKIKIPGRAESTGSHGTVPTILMNCFIASQNADNDITVA